MSATPTEEALTSLIILSGGQICLVSPEDHAFLSQWSWRLHNEGYAWRTERKGGHFLMHRVILGMKPGEITDHINRNRLDNRRGNLRLVTHSENVHNRGGVGPWVRPVGGRGKLGGRWAALLGMCGKELYLGSFPTRAEAVAAYWAEVKKRGIIKPRDECR